jgi:hypothetical protein
MTTPFPFVANTVLTAAQLNAITTLPISAQTASYTLVIGNVGQRVQMTSASSTTITVNTGIFAAGDTIWIQNMGAGTCTITSGTCTVSTASSLALAQYGGGTLVFQSASAATFFSQQASSYGVATGGSSSSITVGGIAYTLLDFTTDSNLVVSKAGLFDILCVAGGGSSGGNGSGGGGAGGVYQGTVYFTAATHAVDVGAGGGYSLDGLPSTIGTVVASFGGGFGSSTPAGAPYKSNGGSGGGATLNTLGPGLGVFGQGNDGGALGSATAGSGGGGQASVGVAGTGTTGGAGGTGLSLSAFTGATITTFVAGGGGGGGSVTGGAGGSSVGGTGSAGAGAATNGTASTGSGGGGQYGAANGGTGASGRIFVRFKS